MATFRVTNIHTEEVWVIDDVESELDAIYEVIDMEGEDLTDDDLRYLKVARIL
jgi:uncharacterized protein (UPF0212 family)